MVFQRVKKSLAEFAARRRLRNVTLLPEKPGGFFDSLQYHRILRWYFSCRESVGRGGDQPSSAAASSAVSGSVQSTMVATQRLMFFPSP